MTSIGRSLTFASSVRLDRGAARRKYGSRGPITDRSQSASAVVSITEYLTTLGEKGDALKYSGLLQLSDLSSDESDEFEAAWHSIATEVRRDVLGRLTELAEDNLELDFTAAFRSCLADSDDGVREMAARGLWECEDRKIIRPLVKLVNSDPSGKVRAAACTTLGRFTALAQEGKLGSRDEESIRSALVGVIDNPEEALEVRRRAVEAVAGLPEPGVEGIIRDAYESGVPELKQSSIYAMGRSSNAAWLPTVLKEMDDRTAAVRYEAANAAGLLGDETVAPHLISLLRDDDMAVQLAAISSLGSVGGALASQALHKCLESEDEAVQEAADEALRQIEFDEDPLSLSFDV